MNLFWEIFVLLGIFWPLGEASVPMKNMRNYCNASCAVEFKYYSSNVPLITFCQVWEDQESPIDPAIEIGIRSLRDSFGARVEFDWVKADIPGGCTDETFLHASPAAVELQMVKSVNGCSVFVGPACSGAIEQIRGLINTWKVPLMTTEGTSISRDQMAASKLISRFGFTQDAVVIFIMKIFRFFNWTNVAVIYDSDSSSVGFGRSFEAAMELGQNSAEGGLNTASRMLPLSSNLAREDYRQILGRASSTARIIIIAASSNITRDIMLTASDLGMTTGDYAYITADLFYASGQTGSLSWQSADLLATSKVIKEAFQSLFVVQLKMPDNVEYTKFQESLMSLSASNYSYGYSSPIKVPHSVMGFFDACRVYGLVLDDILRQGKNPYDGLEVTRRMWNRTFHGVGTDIALSSKGDRIFDFNLLNFNAALGQFVPVMEYTAANDSLSVVRKIAWANRNGPSSNKPQCGYDGTSGICQKRNDGGISNLATVLIILAAVVALCSPSAYWCYKHHNKPMTDEWWRVGWDEIVLVKAMQGSSITGSSRLLGSAAKNSSFQRSQNSRLTNQRTYIENGIYMDTQVAIKRLPVGAAISKDNLLELAKLRGLIHGHILRFVGLCLEPDDACMLYEFCQKGSLADIIEKDSINFDWIFRFSVIHEIIEGMLYLHSSPYKSHGRLKSTNVLIHSRLVVKIGDIGLWNFRKPYPLFIDPESLEQELRPLLWVAPEHLQQSLPMHGTQTGDVYSFAIILQEIILRSGPYENEFGSRDVKAIIREIRKNSPPFRPQVPNESCEPVLMRIMQDCWSAIPVERPSFEHIQQKVKPLVKRHTGNLMDNIIKRMEKYTLELEETVAEKTAVFIEEKKKTEELLSQLLPKMVADKLKKGDHIEAESFSSVTIYFSDIVGFTKLSSASSAVQVVDLLNDLYILFDSIIESCDAYKVETIGDAYVVASGLPVRNGNRHAYELARMSLKILKSLRRFRVRHQPGAHLEIRIGLHSGPCAAGVVGLKMPRYCVFGDTVLTAHHMESLSEPMKIHISNTTRDFLREYPEFDVLARGELDAPGPNGPTHSYWLLGSSE